MEWRSGHGEREHIYEEVYEPGRGYVDFMLPQWVVQRIQQFLNVQIPYDVTVSLSVTRDDTTNTTKENDAADGSDKEVIARSADEAMTEPCSESIDVQCNDAYGMELESNGDIESTTCDDTIDVQSNDAYGMKLEDHKGFESMRDDDIDVQSNKACGMKLEGCKGFESRY